MRLTIELVPSSCWYSNLRNAIGEYAWNKIRKQAYLVAGYRCQVCGAYGKLYCHEVWEYDDVKLVQTLVKFTALCDLCHMVKHIGYAQIRAMQGELDFNLVIRHFMQVNRCSREESEKAVALAWQVWDKRSDCDWTCDMGEYEELIGKE